MTDNKGDLISREALEKSMRKSINERYISWSKTITVADIATLIFDEIDNAPTVENDFHRGYTQGYVDGRTDAKNTEGTWIYQDFDYTCSNCGNSALEQEHYPYLSSYCPFCGAEMEIEP